MKKYLYAVGLGTFWVALVSVALWPFIFGDRIFIDSDTTLYYYPVFDFFHRAIAEGTSFLWNPSIFLGFPVYLSQSAGFFDPLNWALFHLPDSFLAYHLRLLIDFVLVLALSYAAGRQFGLTRLGSLMIGMGYLIAFNWRYLNNVVIANSLFLLPLLFWAGMRLFKATRELERWGWVLLMGAGVGWSFVSGYAQVTVYALFVFGLFYLYYFFFILPGEKTPARMARWAGYGLSIVGIGVLCGLPQILPALEFAPLTVRSEGVAYEVATYKTTEPGDMILFAFPDYLYFPYLSSGRKPLYIGILLFVLALVGVREALRSRLQEPVSAQRHIMGVLSGIFIFCFVASLQWSPLFYLMQKLPVFGLFRFPYRWMYIGAWFLAVLGAYGFDRLYARKEELRRAWLTRVVAAVGSVGVGLVLLLNFGGSWFWGATTAGFNAVFEFALLGRGPFIKGADHYQEAFVRGIQAWQGFLSLQELRFLTPFLLIVATGTLLYWVLWRRISERRFRLIGFALSVATFLSVFAVQWPNSIPASAAQSHTALLNETFSDTELSEYRTFPFMLGASLSKHIQPTYQLTEDQVVAVAEMQFASGWPNMHMYDGRVASVDGYDVFVPFDLMKVLGRIGSTHAGEEETKVLPQEEVIERLLSNIGVIGLLSGKYLISGVPLVHDALSLRATWPASHLGGEVYVYESRYALSRWYLADRIASVPHESLSQLLEAIEWKVVPGQTYLDCASCASTQDASRRDSLVLEPSEPAKRTFRITTETGRWLVFNEAFLPGWIASIDGEAVDIIRANGMGMAVEVPRGTHVVTWEYEGVLQEARILKALGIF